jgi:hypothetical protein
MIFEKQPIPQPINIGFNWVADYFDGTFLSEYSLESYRPNSFYLINQRNAIRFGLFGQNMKFFFENSDGSFMLNGRRLDIGYEVDGKLYMLTNNFNKKDFITYKEASANFNRQAGTQRTQIQSFNFGYKTTYEKDNFKINFQSVVSIPIGKSIFIEVKMTSDSPTNGDLIFFTRGKETERFRAPLEKGVSGQISWTVK